MEFDVLIVGAGPAGLCLARMLSGHDLRIGVVEQQAQAALKKPAFDGREIALTQRSSQLLRQLGLWERIEAYEPTAFAPLKDAKVFNGPSTFAMVIGREQSQTSELGWFVSNHWIRRAAYDCVQDSIAQHRDIELICGQKVQRVHRIASGVQADLDDGRQLRARLLIAADSRFSSVRRAMGLAADMHDFGRSMLVFMMTHTVPHEHVAWEWFGYGQTLALLPMNDDPASGLPRSSVVLTLPSHAINRMAELPPEIFNAEMARRFAHRLGEMQLISTRHAYPLVGVYPRRLVAPHFACVGDAAVGMHPVTAHGFNFGLLSVNTLGQLIVQAQTQGQDIASTPLLQTYERRHRLATKPLYLITLAIAKLYTNESQPALWLRSAALQLGQRLEPFKRAVAASITGK
ncbi:MAG: 5-demethoxyubiquinol-8 5-hydroxylase UbiM [Brachymonas sp.]|nr:5-demethoxyubiquinol-8 5-hydroxylase UbiM [Brachymonas sp.]